MSTFCLDPEWGDARRRMRRTITASLVAHVALFLWLILHQHLAAPEEGIVEISWLEPAPAAVEKPAPAVETPRPTVPAPRPAVEKKFQRPVRVTETAPRPQDPAVVQDRMNERLAALRRLESTPAPTLAAPTPARSLLQAAPAAVAPATTEGEPERMVRSTEKPAPATLKRGEMPRRRTDLALAGVPQEQPAIAPARPETDTVREVLEGVSLSGQVADRPLLSHQLPVYPDWAAREAVEGTTTLSFVVLADGSVRSAIQIQKTSGFADFDQNAIAALRKWRFAPLAGGRTEEQWGTITFRFRLRDR
jgi:protein TonB